MTASWQDRTEELVQILILLAIGGMAGAASFTHVHDWTMDNSPARTDDWFGWANAVVSELTPLASGLEVRRRRRRNPEAAIAFPLAVLIGSALFSLAAQVSQAKTSLSGWVLAALPAIGFLVLAKMVLSRPATQAAETVVSGQPEAAVPDQPAAVVVVDDRTTQPASTPISPTISAPHIEVPTHLAASARFAAANHEQTTGHPITPVELAARMNLTPDIATALLAELGHTDGQTSTRVNGVPVLTGEARE